MSQRCTHITLGGARCQMLAFNNDELCFHHRSRLQRMNRKAYTPPTWRTVPLFTYHYPDDYETVLANLHEIRRAAAHQAIEQRALVALVKAAECEIKILDRMQKLDTRIKAVREDIPNFRSDDHGNFYAVDSPNVPPTEADAPTPATLDPASQTPEQGPSFVAELPPQPAPEPQVVPEPAAQPPVLSAQPPRLPPASAGESPADPSGILPSVAAMEDTADPQTNQSLMEISNPTPLQSTLAKQAHSNSIPINHLRFSKMHALPGGSGFCLSYEPALMLGVQVPPIISATAYLP